MTTRIGVVGGAFNPPHYGHLRPPAEAMATLGLEAVFFLPAGGHPFKSGGRLAAVEHRLAMMRLAIQGFDGFEVCAIEAEQPGISYTVDTLATLNRRFPLGEFFYLPGGDLLAEMHLWKGWRQLIGLAHLCPLARPGHETGRVESEAHRHFDRFRVGAASELDRARLGRFGFLVLPVTPLEISSTDLRDRLRRGEAVHGLTPGPVIDYIQQQRLYEGTVSHER